MKLFKHFTMEDRVFIEQALTSGESFSKIAKALSKDATSISKEIRRNSITVKKGAYGRGFNDCINRAMCGYSYLPMCPSSLNCKKNFCRFCTRCSDFCTDYKKDYCNKLLRPPYVCNGCTDRNKCTLEKLLYKATMANKRAVELLSESRSGIAISPEELEQLNKLVTPLIIQGQSIHNICSNNRDIIMRSERSIYGYVDKKYLGVINLDLPRKVRYKPRKKTPETKVDKKCRIGRSYEDFMAYMAEDGDVSVVQMDSVEGVKGGKVLLTFCLVESMVMLAYLRDANSSLSVIEAIDKLYYTLTPALFRELFPVILTDNGSEFSNPEAIEYDRDGNRRTRIFYCDPSSPYQKGKIENSHELIRRILPKGTSFNSLKQEHINLMMDNINSYRRRKLNDRSPLEVFSFLHGAEVLRLLELNQVEPNSVILKERLLGN